MEAQSTRAGAVSARLKTATTTTADVLDELTGLRNGQNAIKERLDRFEKDTKERFDAVDRRFDAVEAKLDGLAEGVAELKGLIVAPSQKPTRRAN